MAFNSVRSLVDSAYVAGKTQYSTVRKVFAVASAQGVWSDLSIAPGNPRANYYTGDERTATVKTYVDGNGVYTSHGIYHGGNVAPDVKHLHKLCLAANSATVTPASYVLCDYLLFYPLIDMDNDAPQDLYNYSVLTPTIPTLPRYTDGVGVKAILVATNPFIGGPVFTLNYTNSDGVAGRISQPMATTAATNIGTIVNSGIAAGVRGPYIDLQPGDTGIRSVQSISFAGAVGGLGVLVLVKPLATVQTREIAAWAEFDFLLHKTGLPRILDGAYLNFICMPNGSFAGQVLLGEATFVWG